MLVTEGKASKKGRRAFFATAGVVTAAGLALFLFLPVLARWVLWVSVALAASIVIRQTALSLVARFTRSAPAPEPGGQPALAFLIPCLNELPSLQQTVPALRKLSYGGTLRLCYVCEAASTDGTQQYLRECALKDARIMVIEKHTPPAGRGATIQYGLDRAPECDVIGFLDADHYIRQSALDELVRVFGAAQGSPEVIQGACRLAQPDPNWLARLLAVEREWLERVELDAGPRLGGFCHFGGGQGFFRRQVLAEPELAIDESMILDDADLSCRLALAGHRVVFDPRVSTLSREPETLTEFLDQRYRWARGWVQLLGKHITAPLRARGVPLRLRCDVSRFLLTPVGMVWLYFGLLAGVSALFTSHAAPTWLALAGLLWPFLLGPGPYLAGVRAARRRDAPLVLICIPLLLHVYCLFTAISLVNQYLLHAPVRYAKTAKPE